MAQETADRLINKSITGLEKLVAQTEDEYVSKALDLASDITTLANTRNSLRERMLKSHLCNGSNAVQNLEGVYRSLWHRYCNDDMPSLSRCRRLDDLDERSGPKNSIRKSKDETSTKELPFNSSSLPNGLDYAAGHMPSEGSNADSRGKQLKRDPS